MKKSICVSMLAVSAIAAGCATPRYPIMSSPAVSMTQVGFDKGDKAKEVGPVTSTYCMGDDAISTAKGDNNIGLFDEVILKAQKESGARYIANATFFSQGKCVVLEGTAMK